MLAKQPGSPVMNFLCGPTEIKIDRRLYVINYSSAFYFQNLSSYAIKNEFDLHTSIHTVIVMK